MKNIFLNSMKENKLTCIQNKHLSSFWQYSWWIFGYLKFENSCCCVEQLFPYFTFLSFFSSFLFPPLHLTIHTPSSMIALDRKGMKQTSADWNCQLWRLFMMQLTEVVHGYTMTSAWEECSPALLNSFQKPPLFPFLAGMVSLNLSIGPSDHVHKVNIWIRLHFNILRVVHSRIYYQLPYWDLWMNFPSSWRKW